MRIKMKWVAVLWLAAAAPSIWAAAPSQFISDDITVSLREKASNDAPSLGVLHSGDRVTVIESLGPSSFAHVHTVDGRDGWIAARYLADQPAARDRLSGLQQQLESAQSQAKALQSQLDAAHQQLAQLKPSVELAAQNEQLHAQLGQVGQQLADLRRQASADGQQRQTLLVGGGLVGAGIVLGLLLPRLRSNRRRYSDF